MVYLFSSSVVVFLFLLLPKINKKQNLLYSLAVAIIAFECYLCMVAGVMTILHIPVDIYTISIVNFVIILYLIYILIREHKCQQYFIDMTDVLFIITLAVIITYIFLRRFTPDFLIMFETSDPGTHLKFAMNFVNKKAVDGMYLGQLINGLFIESLSKIFSGAYVYKSFIIQYGINFFMSGFIFWAMVRRYGNNLIMRLFIYAVTVAYVLGYPYNDMLFGFVYLQMTITIICYLVCIIQDYMAEEVDKKLYGFLIGAGCLSIGIGYTLFAPIVFISVFCCIAYKAYQEKSLLSSSWFRLNTKFIYMSLYIFLVPTFFTLWFLVIAPRLSNSVIEYGNALTIEGYIYRNLYSDFLLFIIPALCGIFYSIKKKVNLISFLLPIGGIYYLFFLLRMLLNEVSTYYFYKLNYMLWPLILGAFVMGMKEFFYKERIIFASVLSVIGLLFVIYFSDFEFKYFNQNPNFIPFADSQTFFRVYAHNEIYEEKKSQVPEGLVEVSDKVIRIDYVEPIIFVGNWLELYWFEALSNQRLPAECLWLSNADLLEQYKSGAFGRYAVIAKDAQGMDVFKDFINESIVYECDYAYIVENYNF